MKYLAVAALIGFVVFAVRAIIRGAREAERVEALKAEARAREVNAARIAGYERLVYRFPSMDKPAAKGFAARYRDPSIGVDAATMRERQQWIAPQDAQRH